MHDHQNLLKLQITASAVVKLWESLYLQNYSKPIDFNALRTDIKDIFSYILGREPPPI